MCHEFWRYERTRAEEQAAKQKAAEPVNKARATTVPERDLSDSVEQGLQQETALV